MQRSKIWYQQVIAYLMLFAIGLTVLPVKQFHSHTDVQFSHQQTKQNLQTENAQVFSQQEIDCQICLYSFISHYLPIEELPYFAISLQSFLQSLSYVSPKISGKTISVSLRAPPAC